MANGRELIIAVILHASRGPQGPERTKASKYSVLLCQWGQGLLETECDLSKVTQAKCEEMQEPWPVGLATASVPMISTAP